MKMPLLCLQPDNPGPNGTKLLHRLSIPIEIASHRSIKKTEARKIGRREENFSIFFFSVAVMGTAMRGRGGERKFVSFSLSLCFSLRSSCVTFGETLSGACNCTYPAPFVTLGPIYRTFSPPPAPFSSLCILFTCTSYTAARTKKSIFSGVKCESEGDL